MEDKIIELADYFISENTTYDQLKLDDSDVEIISKRLGRSI
ncbi:Phage protein [Streptococcus pneumoniae]|nr:hypothetical protein [Streptococcus pneumoniae]VKC27587.1 Phage protein [Streptococcus pneumoniae]